VLLHDEVAMRGPTQCSLALGISTVTEVGAQSPSVEADLESRHSDEDAPVQVFDFFRIQRPDAELLRKADEYKKQFFCSPDEPHMHTSCILAPFLCKPKETEHMSTVLHEQVMGCREICQRAEISKHAQSMSGRGVSVSVPQLSLYSDELFPDRMQPWADVPFLSVQTSPKPAVQFDRAASGDCVLNETQSHLQLPLPSRVDQIQLTESDIKTKGSGFSVLRDVEITHHLDPSPLAEEKAMPRDISEGSCPTPTTARKNATHEVSGSSLGGSNSECTKLVASKSPIKKFRMRSAVHDQDATSGDDGEKITGVMYQVRGSNPNLFDRLMVLNAPMTNEVIYLQMCVRYSELGQSWVAKRRNEAFDNMDPDAHWRLEQFAGCLTSFSQKTAMLSLLLEREESMMRQAQAQDDRYAKFWLFLEQFRVMKILVRHRRLITPTLSRRFPHANCCERYEVLPTTRSASQHFS